MKQNHFQIINLIHFFHFGNLFELEWSCNTFFINKANKNSITRYTTTLKQ